MGAETKTVGEQSLKHPLHGGFVGRAIRLCRNVEVIGHEPTRAGDLAVLDVICKLDARIDGYVLHAKCIALELCFSVVLEFDRLTAGLDGRILEALSVSRATGNKQA